MNLYVLRVVLLAVLAFSLAALPRVVLGPLVSVAPMGAGTSAGPVADIRPAVIGDSLIRSVVARTPFRARRRPAQVSFEPNPTAVPSVAAPVVKPAIVLTGIVWEREPAAIIEGLPGSDGPRVLRARETAGGLRVRRIEREQVVITGLDTTWTLRVREPWK